MEYLTFSAALQRGLISDDALRVAQENIAAKKHLLKDVSIILNAPKGTGKDTIANIISNEYSFIKREFKAPSFDIACAVIGCTIDEFMVHYKNREEKENACEFFLGMSGRQLMIDISEDFIKPRFGKDYFGKRALKPMQAYPSETNFVFSDSGFNEEVKTLSDYYGKNKIFVIQFLGMGVQNHGNDSRSFLNESANATLIKMPFANDEQVSPENYAMFIMDEVLRKI